MKRLTADNAFEMDMVQLAFNQVYIKDGWTWYRNGPDDEFSACDLIRSAAETLGAEPPPLNDEELSDLLADWLYYGVDEVEGVLGILYRALWAMAEIRARLSRYEDTGLMPDDVTDLMAAHGTAIGKLAEYRMRQEKKTPKCYRPDTGGGCKYLVNDGDDEPIDKCKRCPLCYVDKQRHQSESNAPLTLEELREMDGEPVWSSYYQCWGLISVCAGGKWAGVPFFLFTEDGCRHEKNVEQRRLTLYRRKPEEV